MKHWDTKISKILTLCLRSHSQKRNFIPDQEATAHVSASSRENSTETIRGAEFWKIHFPNWILFSSRQGLLLLPPLDFFFICPSLQLPFQFYANSLLNVLNIPLTSHMLLILVYYMRSCFAHHHWDNSRYVFSDDIYIFFLLYILIF